MTTPVYPSPTPPAKGGMPKWLIILLVILLVLILGCCGGITACFFAARKGVGMLKDAAEEVAGKQGMQIDFSGKGLAMPKRMPSDVTIYPGMRVVMAVEPPSESGSMATLSGGKDSPQKVMEFYEKALTDAGWTGGSASASGDTLTQEFKKGHETIQVTTSGKAGDTTAVINYTKGEKPEEAPKPEEPAKTEETPTAPPATPRGSTGSRSTPTTPRATEEAAAEPTLGPAVRMPTGFPGDLPVYKGFQPTFSMWDKSKQSGTVIFQGKVEPAKVAAYYEKELVENQGWKMDQNMDIGNGSVMTFSKESRKVNVTINQENDGKITNLSIMQQKE